MPFWGRNKSDAEKAADDQLKAVTREYEDRVKTAENGLRDSRRYHEDLVKQARRAVDDARRARDQAIKEAQRAHAELLNPGNGRKIVQFGEFTLFDNLIKTPSGTGPVLKADAAVDSAGVIAGNAQLVRAITIGKLSERGNTKETWFALETTQTVDVFELPPDDVVKARHFAAELRLAAKRAQNAVESGERWLREAEEAVANAEQDMTAINAAEAALAAITADPSHAQRTQGWEAAVAAARADSGAVEAAKGNLAAVRAQEATPS